MFQFWHLQGVLQHDQSAVKKLVRVEILSSLIRCQYCPGTSINEKKVPWINSFTDGVGVTDAIHEAGHHDFSKVCIRPFFVDTDPRQLAVPFLQNKPRLLSSDFFICTISMDSEPLDPVDAQLTGQDIYGTSVQKARHTSRLRQ